MFNVDEAEFRVALLRRLDTLIYLMIAPVGSSDISVTEKVHRLIDYGLTPAEAAKVLGKGANSVHGIAAKRKAKSRNQKDGKK